MWSMKARFLNCGTMSPRVAYWLAPHLDRVPAICLLLETKEGLVLVDSGFGTPDMRDPSRLGPGNLLINMRPDEEETAVRQVERLGFRPQDVRHIVCTHLDRDHAGGLVDFPWARVHVSAAELEAALNPRTRREKERYRRCHFAHGPQWVTYREASGEKWFGLDCMENPSTLPPGVTLVSLPGHTRGHCGVAVDTGGGWILHCGDAFYVQEELREEGRAPLGVAGFRLMAHIRHGEALAQLRKIREAMRESHGAVTLVSSHDQFTYRHLFGAPL